MSTYTSRTVVATAALVAVTLAGGCATRMMDPTPVASSPAPVASSSAPAVTVSPAPEDQIGAEMAQMRQAQARAAAQAKADAAAAAAAQAEAVRVAAQQTAADAAAQAEAQAEAARVAAQRQAAEVVTPMTATLYVTSTLNRRTGPATSYKKVGAYARGDEVQVDGRAANGWYHTPDGFVSGDYLSDTAPAPKPADTLPADTQAAAEAEAARLGVSIVWNTAGVTDDGRAHRGVYGSPDSEEAVDFIYVRPGQDRDITLAVVRHEAAHHAIDVICRTTEPSIAGGRFEHVTDAYSSLYHGPTEYDRWYGYTDQDAAIARAIHDEGRCA